MHKITAEKLINFDKSLRKKLGSDKEVTPKLELQSFRKTLLETFEATVAPLTDEARSSVEECLKIGLPENALITPTVQVIHGYMHEMLIVIRHRAEFDIPNTLVLITGMASFSSDGFNNTTTASASAGTSATSLVGRQIRASIGSKTAPESLIDTDWNFREE